MVGAFEIYLSEIAIEEVTLSVGENFEICLFQMGKNDLKFSNLG